MKSLILSIGIIVFINCSCSCPQQNTIGMDNLPFSSVVEKRHIRNKNQIADCFIENVEYFRKYHRYDFKIFVNSPDNLRKEYDDYYSKYPGADRDPANFFEPYASRYSLKEDRYVTSPFPSNEQLTVSVDTIIYSKDSLFCVAFLIIKGNYSPMKGLEGNMVQGREYDAKAIIGYRSDIEKPFDIYPLKKHSVTGFEKYESAAIMLKDLYFRKLKGKGSAGSVYEGTLFKQNVGDKDFFEKSPYFQKHGSGLFNFQIYRYLGKDYPFRYLNCE